MPCGSWNIVNGVALDLVVVVPVELLLIASNVERWNVAEVALQLAVAAVELLQAAFRTPPQLHQQASGDLICVIWIVVRILTVAIMLREVHLVHSLSAHTEDDPGSVVTVVVNLPSSDVDRQRHRCWCIEIANRVVVVVRTVVWQQPIRVAIVMGSVVGFGVKIQHNPIGINVNFVGKPVEQLETLSGHRLAKRDPLEIVDVVEPLHSSHTSQVQNQSSCAATKDSPCHPRHPTHTVRFFGGVENSKLVE